MPENEMPKGLTEAQLGHLRDYGWLGEEDSRAICEFNEGSMIPQEVWLATIAALRARVAELEGMLKGLLVDCSEFKSDAAHRCCECSFVGCPCEEARALLEGGDDA